MPSTPKVLILDLSKHYGGSNSRILSLMTRSAPGTIALAGLNEGVITRQAVQQGLRVHALAGHKADPRLLLRLVRVIRREGYNVLDSQNIQSKFWANLAALASGTALVSTLNSWYAHEHSTTLVKGRLYTALELWTNQALDLYITVSEKDRQMLLGRGIPAERIELIYNTIDLDVSAIPGDGAWLRQEFGLPADSLVFTGIGRLVPQKGFDILVEALRQAAARIPQVHCLVLGEGEDREKLSAQIRGAGLEERIHLAGYQERARVLSILKASDGFLMPSRYEGTPIALLEAAALGRPILAACAGGIPELVTHEQHAHLVPVLDPAELAQGLVRLAEDRGYAEALGRRAQARVRERFDPETQVRQTWAAYEKALARRRAG